MTLWARKQCMTNAACKKSLGVEQRQDLQQGFTSILHILLVMPILDGWEVCNGISDCHSPQRGTNALRHSCELQMGHHASGWGLFANVLHCHNNNKHISEIQSD